MRWSWAEGQVDRRRRDDARGQRGDEVDRAPRRRDVSGTWKAYLTKHAKEAGIEDPTDDQLRQFDRKRKGKKTSNDDGESPSDPDARITKIKGGTTGFAYRAEHAVDLDTEIVVAADVKPADQADGETVKDTVVDAQGNLNDATKRECRITEVVADKGYHKTETLVWLGDRDTRTYVAPRRDKRKPRWDDKPESWQEAHRENQRRTGRDKGKQLQRKRAERVERSFTHVSRPVAHDAHGSAGLSRSAGAASSRSWRTTSA